MEELKELENTLNNISDSYYDFVSAVLNYMWAFDSGFEVLKDRLGSYIECGKISLLLKSESNC